MLICCLYMMTTQSKWWLTNTQRTQRDSGNNCKGSQIRRSDKAARDNDALWLTFLSEFLLEVIVDTTQETGLRFRHDIVLF